MTDGGAALPDAIAALGARLSQRGPVAYVEACLFGGDGTQASAVWDGGAVVQGPVVGVDAINAALRALGVRADGAHDEFAALGLGAHRNTEDWLARAT